MGSTKEYWDRSCRAFTSTAITPPLNMASRSTKEVELAPPVLPPMMGLDMPSAPVAW